jgi:hypothetical protein
MCAGLVGPKTMEITNAILEIMEQRYVNFILLHHKEKRFVTVEVLVIGKALCFS